MNVKKFVGAIKNRETQATLGSRHRTDTICFKYWKQKNARWAAPKNGV